MKWYRGIWEYSVVNWTGLA